MRQEIVQARRQERRQERVQTSRQESRQESRRREGDGLCRQRARTSFLDHGNRGPPLGPANAKPLVSRSISDSRSHGWAIARPERQGP
jgi:hypothetical protein